MPRPDLPPTMLHPDQMATGDSWEWDCDVVMAGHDRTGRMVTIKCQTRTQGGKPGLLAHQRVVHGIPEPAAV